ncbi:MAG: hydroxylamine reductase, partial [Candidatus Krumholzibacteria bacterium]|nr:hydroxylamine reductase [Candidatus Krumholzibacteria bacterium]
MSMFCYQCQETARNTACTKRGVCGKNEIMANLQDLLIHTLQGIAVFAENIDGALDRKYGVFTCQALFSTITNANFDEDKMADLIRKALTLRGELKELAGDITAKELPDAALWEAETKEGFNDKALEAGILGYSSDEDARSLKSLLLYGLKGIAAYTEHAAVLGFYNDEIFSFLYKSLAAITKDLTADELTALVL